MILLLLGIIVFTHEATHVYFAGNLEGICILNCKPMANGNWTPFGVYLGENPPPLSQNEPLAWIVSLVFGGIYIWLIAFASFLKPSVNTKVYNKFHTTN